jgi:hypothetical protein
VLDVAPLDVREITRVALPCVHADKAHRRPKRRKDHFLDGLLRAQSEDLALMFEWFDSTGYAADIKSLRRDFPEVKWHTFEEWARK